MLNGQEVLLNAFSLHLTNFGDIHVEGYAKMLRGRSKFLVFYEAIFQSP